MEVITKMLSHSNKPQSQQSHDVTNPPNDSRKRKFSDVDVSHSPYFKIRALVQQLRPHVIEVLRTPDFQNCEAANKIWKRINLVMHLYKQIQVEGDQIGSWGMSTCQPLLGERNPKKGYMGEPRHSGTQEERLQAKANTEKSAENKLPPSHINSGKRVDDHRTQDPRSWVILFLAGTSSHLQTLDHQYAMGKQRNRIAIDVTSREVGLPRGSVNTSNDQKLRVVCLGSKS